MIIHSKKLLSSLRKIKPIIEQKTNNPILTNFKIEGNKVMATNMEVGIIDIIETSNTESRLLPFKFLNDICSLVNGDLNIEGLIIKTPGNGTKLIAEETNLIYYPVIEPLEGDIKIEIPAGFISSLIKAAKFVIDSEYSPLYHVNIFLKDGLITVQSSNTQVFYHETFPTAYESEFNVLLTVNTIKCLLEAESLMIIQEKKVSFRQTNTEIIGTLSEGIFPDTSRIFTNTYPDGIVFNKFDLIEKLLLVNVLPEAKLCMMQIEDSSITFKVSEPMTGRNSEEIMHLDTKISPREVGVKHKDLLQLLDVFPPNNETVTLSFGQGMIMLTSDNCPVKGIISTFLEGTQL